jgi:two-component system OmpR family response regulator
MRRSAGAVPRQRFGRVEIDLAARCAFLDGRAAELTAREWAVLEALVLRAGRIVSKAELEQLVLGLDAVLASNALEVHVSALRRKLGHELVETVRGLGYRVGKSA